MAARQHLVPGMVVGVVLVALLGATRAEAVDPRVEAACSEDYLAYCGQYDPDGPSARACMRAFGEKLKPSCVDALIMAGEVTRKEVEARRARAKKDR